MKCQSAAAKVESPHKDVLSDGWFLLRRGESIETESYLAGTLVSKRGDEWFVVSGEGWQPLLAYLGPEQVCRTTYGAGPLYTIICEAEHSYTAREIFSDEPPYRIDPCTFAGSLKVGESVVCVRFGKCFLPLEFLNW